MLGHPSLISTCQLKNRIPEGWWHSNVVFPGLAGFPITVQNLRGKIRHTATENLDKPTPVLHRLILCTVGRPLWDYTSDRDLLTGFRDALKGECLSLLLTAISHCHPAHKARDRGILHRDTSAGKILLAEKKGDDELCGFITDLDFARIQGSTLRRRPVIILCLNQISRLNGVQVRR